MAVIISYDDVTNGYLTSVAEDEVNMLIDIISIADDCLDSKEVPESTQRALKIYAVRHMLQLQANAGLGVLTSRRSPSGASQTFASWKGSGGVGATAYGNLLKSLDVSGCLIDIIENGSDSHIGAWGLRGGCGCE